MKLKYTDLEKALTLLYMLSEDDEIAECETIEELIEVFENNREKEVDIL